MAPTIRPVTATASFGRNQFPLISTFALLLGLVFLLLQLTGCRTEPQTEVWVIGLDGADWDQLDPMIARGELPHLAALRTEGAAGILRSEDPLISPVLWTTIATGKSPDQHGVTWFMTDGPDGTKIPVSSHQRQVRSIWQISSEAGLKSGVVGWWATWPADPINGFLVSDYVGWHSFGVTGRSDNDAGKTWPANLNSTIRALMPHPAEIPLAQVAGMINLPPEQLTYNPAANPYENPINHLRQAMATSRGYTDIVLNRLDNPHEERPALLALYYEGTDAVTHLFGDYQAPKLPWVSQTDFDAYQQVVRQYWRWQDRLLGELLTRRGPETTVVIVSDHGFRVGDERRKKDTFDIETADADHMYDGVVIINGPDIQAGAHLSNASIYDIAPTVLYALGLPVAADMDGRVLTAAMADGVVAAAPVLSVVTYETSTMIRANQIAQPAGASEDLEKMLRSLGYIAGTKATTTPEEVVNMATVLMNQNRFDEAIESLRVVSAEHPEILRVKLNLAQALVRSDTPAQQNEGEILYRKLLAAYPDELMIHEDLSTAYLNAGRDEEALQIFDAGLARDPQWVYGLAGKGQVQMRLGMPAQAEATLKQALDKNPRHFQANLLYGMLLCQAGQTESGLQHLNVAHKLNPSDSVAALEVARVLQKQHQVSAALIPLQNCLNNAGPQADVLAELGVVLMRLGRSAEALAPLKQALVLDPQNSTLLGNLGVACAMNNDLPAAVLAFEKIVVLEPGVSTGHAQLGDLYLRTGQINLAKKEMKKALEIDPELVPALLQLGDLENRTGNTKAAKQLLERARFHQQQGRPVRSQE